PIVVVPPDLVVPKVTAPATVVSGSSMSIFTSVQNVGFAPSVAPASTVRLYLSQNQSFDSTAVLLGSRAVGSLATNAFSNGSTTVTLPANTSAGTYYVLAA